MGDMIDGLTIEQIKEWYKRQPNKEEVKKAIRGLILFHETMEVWECIKNGLPLTPSSDKSREKILNKIIG